MSDRKLEKEKKKKMVEVLAVVQGVVGAGLVVLCGWMLKWGGKVSDSGSQTLSSLIFFLFNPSFAFHSIALQSVKELSQSVIITLSCFVSCVLSAVLGMVLLWAWGDSDTTPRTKVMLLLSMSFSNVGSLPLYLAAQMDLLRKPDVFSFLTVYIATQSFIMWAIFYPLSAAYLGRSARKIEISNEVVEMSEMGKTPTLDSATNADLPVITLKSLALLVFNPVVIAVLLGCVVALIPPVQHVLFVDFPLIAGLSDTLGQCNVGAHLLLLGFDLYPLKKLELPKLLLASSTAVRLVLVPTLVFLFYFLVLRSVFALDGTLMWVPLMLSGTPSNLGIVVIGRLFKSEVASQILLVSYACCIITVPFWNSVVLGILF